MRSKRGTEGGHEAGAMWSWTSMKSKNIGGSSWKAGPCGSGCRPHGSHWLQRHPWRRRGGERFFHQCRARLGVGVPRTHHDRWSAPVRIIQRGTSQSPFAYRAQGSMAILAYVAAINGPMRMSQRKSRTPSVLGTCAIGRRLVVYRVRTDCMYLSR